MRKLSLIWIMMLVLASFVYAEVTQTTPGTVTVTIPGFNVLGGGVTGVTRAIDAYTTANQDASNRAALVSLSSKLTSQTEAGFGCWRNCEVTLTNAEANLLATYVTTPPPLSEHRVTAEITYSIPVGADGRQGTVAVDSTGFATLYTEGQAEYERRLQYTGTYTPEQAELANPQNNLGVPAEQNEQTKMQLKEQKVIVWATQSGAAGSGSTVTYQDGAICT